MDGETSVESRCNDSNTKLTSDSTESSVFSSSSTTCASMLGDSNVQYLTLEGPGGGDPLTFPYSTTNTEFVDILKLALEEFDGLRAVVQKILGGDSLDSLYTADYEMLNKICTGFNKAALTVRSLSKGMTKPGTNSDLTHPKFLQRIINHCYNKAVENEKALNKHYEPFSSCTYGETSFNRMQTIIDEIKPTAQDVFVDLGSGVGQLVVHMAGGSKVKKAFGIEIAKLPAKFAARLEEEFRKLMRFYGKKVRQFSLELGDFLDDKYRELITKEATIIFINNYAFRPELETQIKYKLLFELQSGTKIISTKPYSPLNKSAVNDRQINDLASIVDVYEMKHCPNPCSWTSNDVPYFLHIVNLGKIERYFLNLKPNVGNRSLTPSSSKNSNSRESSVGYRDTKATKKQRGYGPTTRKSWNSYISKQTSNDDIFQSSSTKETMFSSDSDSEVERKRRKARNKERAKVRQAKKNSEKRLAQVEGSGDAKLSADAKEGIELMHQMTQAVSAGQSMDNSAMLAELTSSETNNAVSTSTSGKRKRSMVNGCKQTDAMFPLSDAIIKDVFSPNKTRKRTLNSVENSLLTPSKYEHLNVFLSELKRTYEIFLDNIHATASSVKAVSSQAEKNEQQIKKELEPNYGNEASWTKPTIEVALQMLDRLNQKQTIIQQEMTQLRKIIASINPGSSTQASVAQHQNQVQINGVTLNGIQPQQATNATNLVANSSTVDAVTRFSNVTTSGSSQNLTYASLMNTYLNNLSQQYQSTNVQQRLSDLNQATLSLQNANSQQVNSQQQQVATSYASQLNTDGLVMNNTNLNSANLSSSRPILQWNNDIIAQLVACLSSSDYSYAAKSELVQTAIQQNPAIATLLQSISGENTILNQLLRVNAATSMNYSTPTINESIQSVFGIGSSDASAAINASNKILATTQKPLVYQSQVSTVKSENLVSTSGAVDQTTQGFSASETPKLEKTKAKRTAERKPRLNSKRNKESESSSIEQLASTINEPSSSNGGPMYFNSPHISNQTMPIGVEKILSQQLSIQSQLPLPKEHQSFHSPSF